VRLDELSELKLGLPDEQHVRRRMNDGFGAREVIQRVFPLSLFVRLCARDRLRPGPGALGVRNRPGASSAQCEARRDEQRENPMSFDPKHGRLS
jgi:hypothetical protein